ncbi:MAG: hypothetical protein HKN54_09220 [Flavobacteriaceae bacterium]|nr:hypothetical protein [Flavobacteriaceae bacterium]
MKTVASRIGILGFVLISFYSCQTETIEPVQLINSPAQGQSSEPNLFKSDQGDIYLSWIETDSLKHSKLLFSTLEKNSKWSSPTVIAEGNTWFVNWADFPSLLSFGDNMVVHYLDKSAADTYAYDVKLAISNDNGETWDKAFSPHFDQTNTEHGFVSKIKMSDDKFMVVWLDGRQYAYAEKDSSLVKQMSIRSAIIDIDGNIIQENIIDSRVCDCCQTDLIMTEEGPVVVFRDRSDEEIRDIYFSRFINNTWTEPQSVFDDNWVINGCPVNGPALSANNDTVAVSWFAMEDQNPKVKMAFLSEDQSSFRSPIALDYVFPLGRVDVELNNDKAYVSWMDSSDDLTKIQLQSVDNSGKKSAVFTVSEISAERSSGFPRMVINNGSVYITWTEVGEQLGIKTAKIELDQIQ